MNEEQNTAKRDEFRSAFQRFHAAQGRFLGADHSTTEEENARWREFEKATDVALLAPAQSAWELQEKFSIFERAALDMDAAELRLDAKEFRWFGSLRADVLALAAKCARLESELYRLQRPAGLSVIDAA
ncbi:MAG: hypothetical protein AB7F91_14450 [Parvularculaceae bacterium]